MHKVALTKPSLALRTANTFGILGYISLVLEWVWIVCLLAYPIIKNGDLNWALPPSNPSPSPVIASAPLNGFTIAVAGLVTLICLGIMVYALYTMPRSIGKAGSKITHKVADSITPALTRNRRITKKAKLVLTYRTILAIKVAAILLPLAVAMATSFTALGKDIVLLTTFFIASWALFDFAVQFAITKLALLNTDDVW